MTSRCPTQSLNAPFRGGRICFARQLAVPPARALHERPLCSDRLPVPCNGSRDDVSAADWCTGLLARDDVSVFQIRVAALVLLFEWLSTRLEGDVSIGGLVSVDDVTCSRKSKVFAKGRALRELLNGRKRTFDNIGSKNSGRVCSLQGRPYEARLSKAVQQLRPGKLGDN